MWAFVFFAIFMLLCIVELKINMIINRGKWLNTDNFISGDSSPDEITKKIIKILDLKFDEDGYLVNIKDEYMSLVTYSPFAIDEYIRMLKKMEGIEGLYESILFHDEKTTKFFRLTDFMEKSKLVHFSIGEFYTSLEIESALRKYLKSKGANE